MMPGESNYRRCPSCDGLLIERTLISGNTIGARFWTDGKMEAPMLPQYPALVRCAHCDALLWLPEAQEFRPPQPLPMFQTAPGARDPKAPTEADYLEAIASGLAPGAEREKYCRVHAWHASNDARRDLKSKSAAGELPIQTADNMKLLFAMLDRSAPEQRMLRAELARELGRFAEALDLLKFDFGADYGATAQVIRALATRGESAVAQVTV